MGSSDIQSPSETPLGKMADSDAPAREVSKEDLQDQAEQEFAEVILLGVGVDAGPGEVPKCLDHACNLFSGFWPRV